MRLIAQVCPSFDPNTAWRDGDSRVVANSPIFNLMEIQRESPHSQVKGAFYRLQCPEWVHAIPITSLEAGLEFIVVEQYRHGVDKSSLEVPGGLCAPDENPLDAAKRELLEETGYASDKWEYLGFCAPNPAIQTNRCHFFLALDCVQKRELELDPTEELRVWAVSYPEWMEKMQSGQVHHALILAAFQRLHQSKAWPPLLEQINSVQERFAVDS